MNKVLRAAIRTMSRHQGDMTKDYEKNRKKEKMYPYYKGRSCNTMDRILHLEGRDILLRTYSYDGKVAPLILFFHGGGFVTGDLKATEMSVPICLSALAIRLFLLIIVWRQSTVFRRD